MVGPRRSVLTRGDHARVEELAPDGRAPAGLRPGQPRHRAPLVPGAGVLNHVTIAAFNEVWFRKAPRRRSVRSSSIPGSSTRSTRSARGTACTGGAGFVQYQFLVPFGAEEALRHVIARLAESGAPSFLSVLKRFGAGQPGAAELPGARLDADARHPGRCRPTTAGLLTGSTRSCSTPAGATTSPRTPPRPRRSAAATPALAEWQAVRGASIPRPLGAIRAVACAAHRLAAAGGRDGQRAR